MSDETQFEGAQPLEAPPFTMMHNYLLDVAMRELSPNAWKVLCWAVRQTWGYSDEKSPTGRKRSDVISYSQFLEATGISSKATLSSAIQNCLEKGYLVREQVPSGKGKQTFSYRLNTQYKVQKLDLTTTANVQKVNLTKDSFCTLQGTETVHTKERNKEQRDVDVVTTTLTELGIAPRLAQEIAEARSLAWVDGHLDHLDTEQGQGIRSAAAYLVWAHREGVDAPGRQPSPDKANRYISGEYAEFIEH